MSLFQCDVEELDVEALVDDVDPYVCEYTTERRPVVYTPLNIIEDDADDVVNEDDEVDIETVEDDCTLLSEDLKICIRREQREGSIRRDVARRRLEGDVRHKRFITLHETEERLDQRGAYLASWRRNYYERLILALERVVEKRRRLDDQGHGTNEKDDEISEKESSQQEDIFEDDNSTIGRDSELEYMLQQREILLAKIEFLSRDPLLPVTLREELASLCQVGGTDVANRIITLLRENGCFDDEPAEDPQPGPSRNRPRGREEENLLMFLNRIMPPVDMSQLNINNSESLTPNLVPGSNDAVRDDNDFESDDESNNEYLSPIHHEAAAAQHSPVQGANDDWYSLPSCHYPNTEVDNDGYYSPQFSMYHERTGFLTPQPIRVNAAGGSNRSEDFDEGYDELNRMVSNLRINTLESSEPEQVALQTPQHTRHDHKQQATEIAEGAQTNNAETGRKYIPHTSDDLDLATVSMSTSRRTLEYAILSFSI